MTHRALVRHYLAAGMTYNDAIALANRANGGEPMGCGYCTHCGYGGEPVDSCLHKRSVALEA